MYLQLFFSPVPIVFTMSKSSNLKFMILCCWPSFQKPSITRINSSDRLKKFTVKSVISDYYLLSAGCYWLVPSEVSRLMYPFLVRPALSVDILGSSLWLHSAQFTASSADPLYSEPSPAELLSENIGILKQLPILLPVETLSALDWLTEQRIRAEAICPKWGLALEQLRSRNNLQCVILFARMCGLTVSQMSDGQQRTEQSVWSPAHLQTFPCGRAAAAINNCSAVWILTGTAARGHQGRWSAWLLMTAPALPPVATVFPLPTGHSTAQICYRL